MGNYEEKFQKSIAGPTILDEIMEVLHEMGYPKPQL